MASHLPVTEGLDPSQLDMPNENDKSVSDTIRELHKVQLSHQWDPNLPQEKIDAINEAVKTGDQEKAAELEKTLARESQYESVRAAVRNTDGGEVANTVRAWVLGMFFTTLGSGLNMFLSMRWASIPMKPLGRKLVAHLALGVLPSRSRPSSCSCWSIRWVVCGPRQCRLGSSIHLEWNGR